MRIPFASRLCFAPAKQALLAALFVFTALFAPLPALALDPTPGTAADTNYGLTQVTNIDISTTGELKSIIAQIINILLGFLGVIAVIIIIYAGFKWMTAQGNEETVGEAKQMLTQAVIGLVVIFVAYILANFVITQIGKATGVPEVAQ